MKPKIMEEPIDSNFIETPKEVEAPVEREIMKVMSQEDAYISDRMKSQPTTLDEILVVKEPRYTVNEHRLSLPHEFRPYQDRFGFRWINKKKRAIDEAVIRGWVIINRTLFPDISKEANYLFSTSGAIEKGDAVLAFMSRQRAEAIRKAPSEKSSAIVKSQLSKGTQSLPKGQSGFYKPVDDENG